MSSRKPIQISDLEPNDVCIASVTRTPLGSLGGTLASLSATKLGSIAIKNGLEKANVQPNQVEEVFMGNVLSAGVGQAPARQAALGADIPDSVPCTTVNKVCSSGMKAVVFGAQSIQLGMRDVVVAGGMESMSNCPHYMPSMRFGQKMGDVSCVDGMIKDGLWDPYNNFHMGNAGEICAEKYNISREEQDDYAIKSYSRAQEALKSHQFNELCSVEVPNRRGPPTVISQDEEVSKVDLEKLKKLRPVFKKDGTVTAGNASPISDGAAALVLVSAKFAQSNRLPVMAVIRGYDDAAQKPELFTTSPSLAIPKALSRAHMSMNDIDLFEINEAFSVVSIANMKELGINSDQVNIYGGAVSLGHPLGCSGARIIGTLLSALTNNNQTVGCAGICNGGGGASSLVIERVASPTSSL
eukprot:gb/GECH01012749.1/.p1 GENE.gb/GECH01012749.1/~~gb/GECH01012749.1/.p1  ORF type:complete len:412 (+),score=108.53 gb/GECH01012749.1/:1-1236(+)